MDVCAAFFALPVVPVDLAPTGVDAPSVVGDGLEAVLGVEAAGAGAVDFAVFFAAPPALLAWLAVAFGDVTFAGFGEATLFAGVGALGDAGEGAEGVLAFAVVVAVVSGFTALELVVKFVGCAVVVVVGGVAGGLERVLRVAVGEVTEAFVADAALVVCACAEKSLYLSPLAGWYE